MNLLLVESSVRSSLALSVTGPNTRTARKGTVMSVAQTPSIRCRGSHRPARNTMSATPTPTSTRSSVIQQHRRGSPSPIRRLSAENEHFVGGLREEVLAGGACSSLSRRHPGSASYRRIAWRIFRIWKLRGRFLWRSWVAKCNPKTVVAWTVRGKTCFQSEAAYG